MDRGLLEVEGCSIAWCAVGGPDADDALVLLHGARAHRHWWDPAVAAGLGAAGRRVVAVDLSGHGDSGRRPEYSPAVWAEEALAAVESCVGRPAVLVGHSMGGLVALVAAARRPDLVRALVLVDTLICPSDPARAGIPRGTPAKALRAFPSREAAVESVRLFPPQPNLNPAALRRVAERSVHEVGGEWRWKFDPAVAQRFDDELINSHLAQVECPTAMVIGEHSALVDGASAVAAEEILGRPVPTTVVAGTHHHLILDKPAESAAAIAHSASLANQTIVW